MLSVSRPSDVLVLNCWVTATKLTLCFSNWLRMRGEVQQGAAQAVDLVHHHAIDLAGIDGGQQPLQRGPFHVGAGEAAIVVALGQGDPPFTPLALDEGLCRLPLCIERIEVLFQSFLGGLAGVDGAAQASWGAFPSGLLFRTVLLLPPLAGEPEEGEAVPAGAGSGQGDGAERGITLIVKAEPVRQHLDQKGPPFPLALEQGARQRQTAIGGAAALPARGADRLRPRP